MAEEYNLIVTETRAEGGGLDLFYKRSAHLQQHAAQTTRLVAEGNSMALYHAGALPPVASASLQEAAAQYVASIATAPLVPTSNQVQTTTGVAGVSMPSQPQPPSQLDWGRSRGTAQRMERATGSGRGGKGTGKSCSACTDHGVPRAACSMAGTPSHKLWCPFREGVAAEAHTALRERAVVVGWEVAMHEFKASWLSQNASKAGRAGGKRDRPSCEGEGESNE